MNDMEGTVGMQTNRERGRERKKGKKRRMNGGKKTEKTQDNKKQRNRKGRCFLHERCQRTWHCLRECHGEAHRALHVRMVSERILHLRKIYIWRSRRHGRWGGGEGRKERKRLSEKENNRDREVGETGKLEKWISRFTNEGTRRARIMVHQREGRLVDRRNNGI